MDFSKLRSTSKVTTEWSYPQGEPLSSGWLRVDTAPDHELYWEEYGRADGEPVMFLHGGPGGACAPAMSRFFDPDRYRVILFDQRGCGKSRPTVAADGPAVALANNTTDHLVGDINALREALGITGKMHVFGGSWGSTLALVYAIRNPDKVASLILRGIFLGRTEDLLYMYQGNAATFAEQPYALTEPGAYIAYPDEWKAFVEVIPAGQRGDMMGAYKAIFDMVPADEDAGKFGEAEFALCFAQIEAHFFANDLFLKPDEITDGVKALKGVPVHIVHGRFDQVCPLTQGSRLVQALEEAGMPPATYVRTDAGHSAMEAQTVLALTAIMDGLPPI